jgi:hypothetical protein
MTEKEFNERYWYKGMIATYKGVDHNVQSVDFEEMLIGILVKDNEQGTDFDIKWVRAENCKLKTE